MPRSKTQTLPFVFNGARLCPDYTRRRERRIAPAKVRVGGVTCCRILLGLIKVEPTRWHGQLSAMAVFALTDQMRWRMRSTAKPGNAPSSLRIMSHVSVQRICAVVHQSRPRRFRGTREPCDDCNPIRCGDCAGWRIMMKIPAHDPVIQLQIGSGLGHAPTSRVAQPR
jgi:hypothetical protein